MLAVCTKLHSMRLSATRNPEAHVLLPFQGLPGPYPEFLCNQMPLQVTMCGSDGF